MFQITYHYQKRGPEYVCTYPNKEDADNSIFTIRGTNDQGKSTLMQMIALGLYGLDSSDIDESLKDKMRRLISKDTDKCEFEFVIASKDGKIKLDSKLRDRNVSLLVNDKKRAQTYVQDNFKILFDIPDEPLKKLSSALRSIDSRLSQYQDYARRYRDGVKEYDDKVDDYQRKATDLNESQRKLERLKTELVSLQDRLDKVRMEFDTLKKARLINSYEKICSEVQNLQDERTNIARRIKELKAAGVGGGNKKYREALSMFTKVLYDLKFSIDTSDILNSWLDNDEKKRLQRIAKEVKEVITVKGLSADKLKEWRLFFERIRKKLESDPMSAKKLPEENQIDLLTRLINILKDYVDTNPRIPGTTSGNANAFLEELERSRRELIPKVSKKAAFNKAAEACTEINRNIMNVAEAFSQIPKIEVSEQDDLDQLQDYLNRIQEKLEKNDREKTRLAAECERISQNELVKVRSLGMPDAKVYDSTKKEAEDLESKVKNHEIEIGSTEGLIKSLEKVEKPPSKFTREQLRSLYRAADKVLLKIQSWRECISKMNLDKMTVDGTIDSESNKLYSALGDYFADVLKAVYFENQKWVVEKIDLINRCYLVQGRRPIDFIDIGTGHTALNSLLARLKQDCGGKKKILLFDEMGIMDTKNMNRLLDEIRRQVDSGDVLFALLSQVDNSLEKAVVQPVKCD